jgi:carbonic anhydrase
MSLKHLLEQNRAWAARVSAHEPDFFATLAAQQSPEYLWIGCSDSRVPANQIIGLLPGEVFVHRNVANIVVHSDLNCLSVIQYAVEVLKVKHIIVCGHYGCGGVRAAMGNTEFGLIDNWLRHLKDIYSKNREQLDVLVSDETRLNLFCELNVLQQVYNVASTTIVQGAWRRGQSLSVHAWIYGLSDGIIKDLHMEISNPEQLDPLYRMISPK